MSDDLAIGGPTGTTVVTTELVQEATMLSGIVYDIESCQRSLQKIDVVVGNGILTASDAPQSALLAEQEIRNAFAAMTAAREQCADLQHAVSKAAEHYEWVDRTITEVEEGVAALLAYFLGAIAPALLLIILPGAIPMATGLGALAIANRDYLTSKAEKWWKENSRFLTDPGVVKSVRLSVMSADDFTMGFLRVPLPLAHSLGDEGLGLTGVDTSAGALAFLGPAFGLFRESLVRVERRGKERGLSTPEGIQDRLERIPRGDSQIRIDRYSSPGVPDRFEVYIAGTEDFSPVSGGEPFDLTSNVSAMAGGSDGSGAASYDAVVEAMRREGIDSTSSVDFTGYSQGGLLAAQLAASGNYATESLVTFGAPAGQVFVPHDIPYLAVEHSDDLIPALGGSFAASDPLVVSRRVFDAPPASSAPPLPAHWLTRYADTAALIDQSPNAKLHEKLKELWHPDATNGTATFYQAERVTG